MIFMIAIQKLKDTIGLKGREAIEKRKNCILTSVQKSKGMNLVVLMRTFRLKLMEGGIKQHCC